MDKRFLEDCLARGMSLPQIGALANRDPSTVGYWVQKHGLVANGRAKYAPGGRLTREQLEPLVHSETTLREIAEHLNVQPETVRRAIARHGLLPPSELREAEIQAAIESGAASVIRRCPRHGATEYALVGARKRPRCKLCRAEAVARRRRKVKGILAAERGGCCELCGYDRCLAALQFHHRDPNGKKFGIAARGLTRSIDKVRAEAEKCALLCANCHAEVEARVATLT